MAVLLGVILTAVAYCILLERKVSAWMQDRIGPNRVGPAGLLQPLADGVKFFIKEDIISARVDRAMFVLAPAMAFTVAGVGFAVIPWAGMVRIGGELLRAQVATIDIGLLYILAVGSLAIYGVVLGGWASNNKYSLYGGIRGAASMLSYEVPMGLAILVVVLTSGEVRLERIVDQQIGHTWNILLNPVAFIILLTTAFAETNRAPFDLAEAEQELIGGYQTEYSSMKMALFYLGEYFHMITSSAFISVLFLGGWELFPWSDRTGWAWVQWLNHAPTWGAMACRFGVMFAKVFAFIFFFMWIRWTLPRFRFDQLMGLCWKGLVPVGLLAVTWAGVLVYQGCPMSFWATVGNAVIVAAMLTCVAVRPPRLSGRQLDLPPVRA
ncbi:MAG: NADH-quinone oxidoreductase subunit NuoH [Planctomycetes bacterium]|nr:NADH-quinone oxidoreductase subunit NuoH [Planctomycetota bacterium]